MIAHMMSFLVAGEEAAEYPPMMLDYRTWTRTPDPDDYLVKGR